MNNSTQSLADFFSPQYSRCVLRTKSDQGSFYPFIVDINNAGEVLVFEHPKPDDATRDRIDYGHAEIALGSQQWIWMSSFPSSATKLLACLSA